jgi:type IV pilus assembly protein PilY1
MRSHRSTHALMKRLPAWLLAFCVSASCVSSVLAQEDPDLRQFEPFVMVIVDSSGSMERLPTCKCTTDGCEECLPKCGDNAVYKPSPGSPGYPISTSDPDHLMSRKNRWAYTLEALTGQFNDFQCNRVERNLSNGATYDVGYFMPYHQPWKCPGGLLTCPMPSKLADNRPLAGNTGVDMQVQNGVLDRFASRLRFGLMTFDGIETYQGGNPLIHANTFSEVLSESQVGMWSYAGPKPFHYPRCADFYKMDTGARSSLATEGGLITLTSNACPSPPCSMYQVNDTIQNTLLRTRPYGGTPIAASLDDLFYHFKTDVTDTVARCRDRYALLITDGRPDDDYRDHGCDCVKDGDCDKFAPEETEAERALHRCPYPRPEEAAYRLVNGYDGDPKQMLQLFVIGISIDDEEVKKTLNRIAYDGGSTEADPDGNFARFADGFDTRKATLDAMFSKLTPPVSRAVPAFVTSHLNGKTFRLTAGFQKATGALENGVVPPWIGILERQRFLCPQGTNAPSGADLDATKHDLPHVDLGKRADTGSGMRKLFTALPSGTVTTSDLRGTLSRGVISARCGGASTDYCSLVELDPTSPKLDPALLELTGTTTEQANARQKAMDWMYGRAGSIRKGQNLGDIYHSSPTVWRDGTFAATDDAYNLFRDAKVRPDAVRKPVVMYIGSNDGLLHAFSVDAYNAAAEGNIGAPSTPGVIDNRLVTYEEGEEMWGFVPPVLLPKIDDQLTGHQYGVDGTPVIKDMLFGQATGAPNGTEYHTVLAGGLRAGGKAYYALDVSDPINPKFLWQFTDPKLPKPGGTMGETLDTLGYTYGKPVLAQMNVSYTVGIKSYSGIRAVAILAGGRGTKWNGSGAAPPSCNASTMRAPSAKVGTASYFTYGSPASTTDELRHRDYVRCWNTEGRAIFFVDVETGYLIKALWSTNGTDFLFPSPVSGSPTVFPDSIGAVAKEGYVMDADGVLWRLDFTSDNPDAWTAKPFHDLFWNLGVDSGEPSYEIPLLTVDSEKRLVIIAASGDTDNFERLTARNRLVSLTKMPTTNIAALNWEMDGDKSSVDSLRGMVPGELVTGSMALFEGRLFAATFAPKVSSDLCDRGRGRLWSLHYNQADSANSNQSEGGNPSTKGPKRFDITESERALAGNAASPGIGFFNVELSQARENVMVFGLGATQLRCPRSNTNDNFENYFGEKLANIQETSQPTVWLVAQATGDTDLRQSGSLLGRISVQLERSSAFTRMTSWASSTE